jgi:betaine-aldehyde dehydrogenase
MTARTETPRPLPKLSDVLPKQRGLYYGGRWQEPAGGYLDTWNPGTGESLGTSAQANAQDVDAAARAAHRAFKDWQRVKPLERSALLKRIAAVLREHAEELALLDAANCGNPVGAMVRDVHDGASYIDFFAGLVTELKGDITPMGEDIVNLTVREPWGVCARIVAYNHPLMFAAMKIGAPLAAGNTLIIKPPPQAPLSAYRMMELIDGIVPPGVINLLSGGRECGEALTAHPLIPVVTLVGSVESGRACARSAADRLKKVSLELGGKNALIVYPDADIPKAIEGAIKGMNFTWCGQSCGSTSRLFVPASLHDRVLDGVLEALRRFRPGIPTELETTMGAIISEAQVDKIMKYIEIGKSEARLITGGKRPEDPKLAKGHYVEPTVFDGVDMTMRIAREEIFGPVLSVIEWDDEDKMLEQVNAVDYGLTASIYTTSLATAHRASRRVEAGYVWVNNAAPHFVGVPFGGYKFSGVGREESIEELYAFAQTKNINITL